jgi:hypothetical protein
MYLHIVRGSRKRLPRLGCNAPLLVLLLISSFLLTAQVSRAADECIEKPNAPAPQGSHWYYRIDRATKRQCWYVGAEGAKIRAPAREAAAPVRTPVPKPAPQPIVEAAADDGIRGGMVAAADEEVVQKTPPAVASLNWQSLPTSTFSTGDGALPDIVAIRTTPQTPEEPVKPMPAPSQETPEDTSRPAIPLGYLLAVLAGALGIAAFVGYAVLKLAGSQPKLALSERPARQRPKPHAPAHLRRSAETTPETEALEERASPGTAPSDRGLDIETTLARLLHELEQRHGRLTGANIKAHRTQFS